jgi:hypothetical protein
MKLLPQIEINKLIEEQKLSLKPTQNRLCIPIVFRIYKKMRVGIKFTGIKVDGDLIIDGHHRFLASILAGFDLEKFPSYKTSVTNFIKWEDIEFVDEDWDTMAKIEYLNMIDAENNGITLEELTELLK